MGRKERDASTLSELYSEISKIYSELSEPYSKLSEPYTPRRGKENRQRDQKEIRAMLGVTLEGQVDEGRSSGSSREWDNK